MRLTLITLLILALPVQAKTPLQERNMMRLSCASALTLVIPYTSGEEITNTLLLAFEAFYTGVGEDEPLAADVLKLFADSVQSVLDSGDATWSEVKEHAGLCAVRHEKLLGSK